MNSEHKILSFKSSLFYFRFCFFALFVWWLLENNEKLLKKIYIVLLICFSILIFDSIFQYLNGYNLFNMKIIEKDRISSFFGDELKMGGFLMRLFPFLAALSFFFYDKKKHSKYLIPSTIFILFINFAIYLSGERTSFFLFNFTIFLFIVFLNNFLKIRLFLLIANLIAVFFLILIDTPYKKRLINLTVEQTQINKTLVEKYIFSKQYNEHYLSAWKMFRDNQLIGIGPKNFREICKMSKYNISSDTCSTHPHNIPLQLLSETGLIGFSIYFILNIIVWFNLFKNLFAKVFKSKKNLNNFQISLLINIAILIWPLSPNGNLFNNWLSVIFYYPVGFFLWSMQKNKKMYLNSIKKLTIFK